MGLMGTVNDRRPRGCSSGCKLAAPVLARRAGLFCSAKPLNLTILNRFVKAGLGIA